MVSASTFPATPSRVTSPDMPFTAAPERRPQTIADALSTPS
jgi:hypothetical protein